ncbi:3'(2'),5'-bisphosphate nucleotidase CysQ [Aureimonas fodinaquatilis]|uniref:3'(2'),5'-bisphosphate nucleotidase CysQ n=1 Tax=Aureimonas fodinaquatilis TaxID=2565783 RepID=A0A5B0E2N0_9HYPH|nr:3'(2'),5'-bisphosphate nucleotidase CysQ [Aureimonas fodinaquatilis]KAA0972211.1 3'(2'),5'-bisphosphate nucleotidase CysQ [Aureimonas fodinaquatilis]
MAADDLEVLSGAAKEAGRIALRYFQQNPQVFWKEGNSPVSQADLAVDGFLRDYLFSARPRYGWVSEETASEPPSGSENRFFIVDPIDGTRSFLRGEATWCVALAVVENGRPTAGLIYAPITGEVFAATADGQATLNGAPLMLDDAATGRRLRLSLPDRVRQRLPESAADLIDFAPPIPSLAYRLALVANGVIDGTIVQPRANDWDIAAADLILERAGGTLLTTTGARHSYGLNPVRHNVLVAGGDKVLERVRSLADSLRN